MRRCEEYFSAVKVPIPHKVQGLLRECLNAKEAGRPHDFATVEKRLLEIYREETTDEYLRSATNAAAATADTLNNRALSFLDLGKPEEAERLLAAGSRDRQHTCANIVQQRFASLADWTNR